MHARIDVLMRPCFWSLLPSRVLDWVVIIVSVRYQSAPLNTPLHPISVTSTTLRACPHRTVLLSVGVHEHHSVCMSLHQHVR